MSRHTAHIDLFKQYKKNDDTLNEKIQDMHIRAGIIAKYALNHSTMIKFKPKGKSHGRLSN